MTSRPSYICAALVATKDRWELLTQRALPSIRSQTLSPDLVVLVNDGRPIEEDRLLELPKILGDIPIEIMPNKRSPGAAGAWNTGLRYLRNYGFDGYVAILDDDDEWDKDHIALNMFQARETGADLVVSGLRRVASGKAKPRMLPTGLQDSDFLRGNPGLQGSNTFVSLSALERAGDFTDGLPSMNDRDLAVRLLRSSIKVAYTKQWTATWHHGVERQTLSSPRSREKVLGLQWFWRRYSCEMNDEEIAAYLDRAFKCFGVTSEEVLDNWGIDGIGAKKM
ncbi:MAG: glycosyltransferase [Syntrophotaleaceae bacterium]